MNEDFTYDELIKYLKGEVNATLQNKIENKKKTDREFSDMLDNLEASQQYIKYIANQKRKEKFESWLKEDTEIKKRNYFFFLKLAASFLFLLSIGVVIYYFVDSKNEIDHSLANQNNLDSLKSQLDSIITVDKNKFVEIKNAEQDQNVIPSDSKQNSSSTKQVAIQNESEQKDNTHSVGELSWAINENYKDEYVNSYEFDHIPGFTRGSRQESWIDDTQIADSLFAAKRYTQALDYYKKLSHHPEIWERIAFTYSKLGDDSLALKFYDKYKVLQENKDESDWGEWLLLLNAYPNRKEEFRKKTNIILSFPEHKYYQNVDKFRKKYSFQKR